MENTTPKSLLQFPLTLLYVEDNPEAREKFAQLLKRRFARVISAENGKQGLELFSQENPDIVVTDIRMPEMDGLAMATIMKETRPTVPIIITTAFNSEQYLREALLIGVDGFVEKPLSGANALYPIYQHAHICLERKKHERTLKLLNQYQQVVDLRNAVSKTCPKGIITYVNDAFCELTGFTKEELIGKNHNIVRHPDVPSAIFKDMWSQLKGRIPWKGTLKCLHKNGSAYYVDIVISPLVNENGEIEEYIALRHDITEMIHIKDQLESEKERYRALSITDALTGIFNRQHFNSSLAYEVNRHQRYGHPVALALFDIDLFKDVNDTWGHDVGDSVLIGLVRLIEQHIRSVDIFSRTGGEEFAIIMPNTSVKQAFAACDKLREVVSKHAFETVNTITISFGVTDVRSGDIAKNLYKRADEALYCAKNNGRNRVEKAPDA